MGQVEVYEWLRFQRRTGRDDFFSVKEIEKGIRNSGLFPGNGRGVRGAVIALEAYGYLEVQRSGKLSDFRRVYRLKKAYNSRGSR